MHSGEIIVIGENHIDIPIHRYPCEAMVYFKEHLHHHHHVPCDPGGDDMLWCELHASNLHLSGFVLRIFWSVSRVREIVWRIYY
jgi:hypothetical protein